MEQKITKMQTTLDMEHAVNSHNDTCNADVSERLSGLLATIERLHSQWKTEQAERSRLQQLLFDKRDELYHAVCKLTAVKKDLRHDAHIAAAESAMYHKIRLSSTPLLAVCKEGGPLSERVGRTDVTTMLAGHVAAVHF
jgi:hypothetical protein